jgi:hypothetical protein
LNDRVNLNHELVRTCKEPNEGFFRYNPSICQEDKNPVKKAGLWDESRTSQIRSTNNYTAISPTNKMLMAGYIIRNPTL